MADPHPLGPHHVNTKAHVPLGLLPANDWAVVGGGVGHGHASRLGTSLSPLCHQDASTALRFDSLSAPSSTTPASISFHHICQAKRLTVFHESSCDPPLALL